MAMMMMMMMRVMTITMTMMMFTVVQLAISVGETNEVTNICRSLDKAALQLHSTKVSAQCNTQCTARSVHKVSTLTSAQCSVMQSTFVQKLLPVKWTELLSTKTQSGAHCTKWATKSAVPSASGHWEWPRLQLLRQSQFTNSATSTGAISTTETHTAPESTRDHQQSNTGLVSSSHQS